MLFDANPQAALGFLVSQITHIEPKVWAKKYPAITYSEMVPLDFSAHPWAPTVTYYSTDMVGRAEWYGGQGQDFPLAEINRTQHQTAVHMAATGYKYDVQELNQARLAGVNLTEDKAAAARRAYEEKAEAVAYYGDTAKGIKGLVNSPSVTAVAAAQNAGGTSAEWGNKTAQEIVRDINGAITGIHTGTNTIEMADTIVVPLTSFAALSERTVTDLSTMTILEYIKQNNFFTATTGRALTVRAMRHLEAAGGGGTKRMIAYARDPEVLKMHVPMPLQFFAPQLVLLDAIVPGIFRLGGLDIRRPGAMRYVDGI